MKVEDGAAILKHWEEAMNNKASFAGREANRSPFPSEIKGHSDDPALKAGGVVRDVEVDQFNGAGNLTTKSNINYSFAEVEALLGQEGYKRGTIDFVNEFDNRFQESPFFPGRYINRESELGSGLVTAVAPDAGDDVVPDKRFDVA